MAWNDPTPEELAFQAIYRQDYPQLITRDSLTKKTSGAALANKNARLLLKQHFPGVKFRVGLLSSSWTIEMMVEFPRYAEAPAFDAVRRVLYHFPSQDYDIETESNQSRKDPEGRAFRQLFGSVTGVITQHLPLSPEDLAKERAKHLRATLPQSTVRTVPKGRL